MEEKIFITGASGGIGSSITKKFNECGCNLILTSSSLEKLSHLKDLYGDRHSYYQINLSNLNEVDSKMDEISKDHPDISIIVNNAGLTSDSLLLRMKLEQWHEVMNTNLSSQGLLFEYF